MSGYYNLELWHLPMDTDDLVIYTVARMTTKNDSHVTLGPLTSGKLKSQKLIVVPGSVFLVRDMSFTSGHGLDSCSQDGLNSTLNPAVKRRHCTE